MGCFQVNCGISDLPIRGGDPIRVLLLKESPYSMFGIRNIWQPFSLPIMGEYNDYGSVENVKEGLLKDIFLKGICKRINPVKEGKNPYHDVATHSDMTFEELLNAVQLERANVLERSQSKILNIRQVFIREDVWQAIVKLAPELWEYARNIVQTQLDLKTNQPDFHIGRLTDLFGFLDDGISYHWALLLNNEILNIDESVMHSIADIFAIECALQTTHWYWRPTYAGGPQHAEWNREIEVRNIFLQIAKNCLSEEQE